MSLPIYFSNRVKQCIYTALDGNELKMCNKYVVVQIEMLHRYVISQIRMWHCSVTCQNEMVHGLVVCQIKIYQGCIVADCLFKSLPGLTANKPSKLCTGPSIAESVSMPLLTHCAENPLAVCGLLAHKAQYCRKCIHAFTDPLCWESPDSLWFTRTQGPILQKVYPCLYWPTVLRIHWQAVVYSHTRPNIAESVSMPLLTHCAENPRTVCGLLAHKAQHCRKYIHAFTDSLCWESTGSLWLTRTQGPVLQIVYPCLYWPTVLRIHWQSVAYSHIRPNIAESVSMPLLTNCAENPRAVCGLLAHKAQYCRKCIHASTDPLCWESTGSLWFTRTQGPVLQKVYPCLYWPTVLRIHRQSVAYSHMRPNIAESKYCSADIL